MNTTKDDQLVEVYLENSLRVTDQGDHSSWKDMEFSKTIFQAWKVMENSQGHGKSWRVMENDDDVLEFFVKMNIIHCLPFTFPGISVRSLISRRHLVSCCMITYFVLKKYAVPIGHGNSFFWSWKSHGKSLLKKSGHPD